MREAAGAGGVATPPSLVVEEFDGVTAVRPSEDADAGSRGTDAAAGLLFRVGAADEPLAQRGVTHLVEHLALSAFDDDGVRFNGFVGATRTSFYAQGRPAAIGTFLSRLTRSLHELPADRVEAERRVLQTEGQRRAWGIGDMALAMRYGATGLGRAGLPEWGLEWLEHDGASAWAREWFTSGNAVLWSTVQLPGLELRLPSGGRRPVDLGREIARFPSWSVRAGEHAILSSVVPRATEVSAAVQILQRRLQQRLRREEGLSYTVDAAYEALSGDHALLGLVADLHTDHVDRAASIFLDTVQRLAADGPDVDEVADHRRRMRDQFDQLGAMVGWLDHVAQDLLFGRPDAAHATFLQELDQLDPTDVRDAARLVRDRALIVTPVEVDGGFPEPFAAWEVPAVEPVRGVSIPWRHAPPRDSMRTHFSDDGVTVVDDRGEQTTVRFDACVGVVAWTDGSRLLYGQDGTQLMLHAKEWRRHDQVRDHVDTHAPRPFVEVDRDAALDPGWDRAARRWWWRRLAQRMVGSVTGWVVATLLIALVVYVLVSPRAVPLAVILVGVIALEFRKQRREEARAETGPS